MALRKVDTVKVGSIFGNWTVLEVAIPVESAKGSTTYSCLCRCTCGVEKLIPTFNLINKRSTQCSTCAYAGLTGRKTFSKYEGIPVHLKDLHTGLIIRTSKVGKTRVLLCEEWYDKLTFCKWCVTNEISATQGVLPLDVSKELSPINYKIVPRGCRNTTLLLNGIPAYKLAKSNGVSRQLFESRLQNGWDVEGAAMIPPNSQN